MNRKENKAKVCIEEATRINQDDMVHITVFGPPKTAMYDILRNTVIVENGGKLIGGAHLVYLVGTQNKEADKKPGLAEPPSFRIELSSECLNKRELERFIEIPLNFFWKRTRYKRHGRNMGRWQLVRKK